MQKSWVSDEQELQNTSNRSSKVKLAHQACSVRQNTSSIEFPEAEEFVGWGGETRTGAATVGCCASIPHPCPTPLSPKGMAHLIEWLICKCALVKQAELEQLAMGRSFQLRKPSSETQTAVTVFLFSSPP